MYSAARKTHFNLSCLNDPKYANWLDATDNSNSVRCKLCKIITHKSFYINVYCPFHPPSQVFFKYLSCVDSIKIPELLYYK